MKKQNPILNISEIERMAFEMYRNEVIDKIKAKFPEVENFTVTIVDSGLELVGLTDQQVSQLSL